MLYSVTLLLLLLLLLTRDCVLVCVVQAQDEGVAVSVAAYLDEETHTPPPRLLPLLTIFLHGLLAMITNF